MGPWSRASAGGSFRFSGYGLFSSGPGEVAATGEEAQMFDSKTRSASRRRRIAKAGVVLLVLVVLGGMGAGLASASPPFTVSIDKPVSVSGLDVSLSGTADSPSSATHHIDVDWGDGSAVDTIP